jgi:hypothetical protein
VDRALQDLPGRRRADFREQVKRRGSIDFDSAGFKPFEDVFDASIVIDSSGSYIQ